MIRSRFHVVGGGERRTARPLLLFFEIPTGVHCLLGTFARALIDARMIFTSILSQNIMNLFYTD